MESGENEKKKKNKCERYRNILKFSSICGCDISIKALYYIVLLALDAIEC